MDDKKKNFFIGLCITLGTVVVGLISFIIYLNLSPQEIKRCEYNGWAYANGEIYDSSDGCNTCFCNNGATVCTERACTGEVIGEKKSCTYNGITYKDGEGFDSTDGCNSCGCNDGEVACTLMACER